MHHSSKEYALTKHYAIRRAAGSQTVTACAIPASDVAKKAKTEEEKKSKSQIDTLKSELVSKDKEFEKIKKESDEQAILKLETKYKDASKKKEKENEINNRRLSERLNKSETQNQEMQKLLKQKNA